jgi:regulator of protease activity HflC (stomatin/prohibitin superfamily)
VAEGSKQEAIKESEGEMQKRINEATGKASEIEQVATATANGIRAIAIAINEKGGKDAVNLRIAEQYLLEFGKLAKESNTMIMPSNLTDISSIIATATKVFDATKE